MGVQKRLPKRNPIKDGITEEEYNNMVAKQNNKCLICDITFDTSKMNSRDYPCVDHDHATGKIRGILCGCCNKGLGLFYDNIENLNSAITYLRIRG